MSRAYQLAFLAVILVVSASGCRSRDDALARRAEEFEVVSEGSANGVTSTIAAPGESPAPLLPPPITDTNVDTTTSFTILGTTTTATGTGQPGTLADILPQEREPRRIAPRTPPSPPAEPPVQPVEPVEPAPSPPSPPVQEQPTEPRDQPQEQPWEPEPSEPAEPPTTTTTPRLDS